MSALPLDAITPRIATVRGQRVVIDADLAALYGVLRALMAPPDPPKRPTGFVAPRDADKKISNRRA
jgi:hypothetical protein